MVQLSKKKLDADVSQRIETLFYSVLSCIHTQSDFQHTIIGIMSKIELDVFARRIAVIFLLIKNADREHIHSVLKVSHSTISKYAMILANNTSVREHFTALVHKQKIDLFIRDIEHIIMYPGRIGSSWSANLREKHRFEKEKKAGI